MRCFLSILQQVDPAFERIIICHTSTTTVVDPLILLTLENATYFWHHAVKQILINRTVIVD